MSETKRITHTTRSLADANLVQLIEGQASLVDNAASVKVRDFKFSLCRLDFVSPSFSGRPSVLRSNDMITY